MWLSVPDALVHFPKWLKVAIRLISLATVSYRAYVWTPQIPPAIRPLTLGPIFLDVWYVETLLRSLLANILRSVYHESTNTLPRSHVLFSVIPLESMANGPISFFYRIEVARAILTSIILIRCTHRFCYINRRLYTRITNLLLYPTMALLMADGIFFALRMGLRSTAEWQREVGFEEPEDTSWLDPPAWAIIAVGVLIRTILIVMAAVLRVKDAGSRAQGVNKELTTWLLVQTITTLALGPYITREYGVYTTVAGWQEIFAIIGLASSVVLQEAIIGVGFWSKKNEDETEWSPFENTALAPEPYSSMMDYWKQTMSWRNSSRRIQL
jgi:hypothetical protein